MSPVTKTSLLQEAMDEVWENVPRGTRHSRSNPASIHGIMLDKYFTYYLSQSPLLRVLAGCLCDAFEWKTGCTGLVGSPDCIIYHLGTPVSFLPSANLFLRSGWDLNPPKTHWTGVSFTLFTIVNVIHQWDVESVIDSMFSFNPARSVVLKHASVCPFCSQELFSCFYVLSLLYD